MIGVHYWPTPNGWKVTIMSVQTAEDQRMEEQEQAK
jgi:hypothetical protein